MTKTDLSILICSCLIPVEFKMETLTFAFGFKRKSGLEVTLRMATTGLSEEQVQTEPPMEIHKNIEQWCKDKNFKYSYNPNRDAYTFKYEK